MHNPINGAAYSFQKERCVLEQLGKQSSAGVQLQCRLPCSKQGLDETVEDVFRKIVQEQLAAVANAPFKKNRQRSF